jgi:hypothetical protein
MSTTTDDVQSQLLHLMAASQLVLDSRNNKNQTDIDKSIDKLRDEYVKSILLLKKINSEHKVAALLKPAQTAFERQMFSFKESISIGIGENV